MDIRIKYIDKYMIKLKKVDKGNWIDVRASKVFINGIEKEWSNSGIIHYKKGDRVLVKLGFAMELPKGYEAFICARSSTFRNYGLMLVNSMGIIDTSYCGDEDEWMADFISYDDNYIVKNDRIAQFRIIESMGNINFNEVKFLDNKNRGGFGSTGVE